jgi:hypothetical protein
MSLAGTSPALASSPEMAAGKPTQRTMNPTQITTLEPGNRIQLPAEWAKVLGLHGLVVLDKTAEGILVRPCSPTTWDDFFATKLAIGSAPPNKDEKDLEVTGDDLLF